MLSFHLEHEDLAGSSSKKKCGGCSGHEIDRVERPLLSSNDKKMLRVVLFLLICMPYYTSFTNFDWHYFMVPFTNWTLVITTIGIVLSLWASLDKERYGRHALCALQTHFNQDDELLKR